jgi:hypothetical protein
MAEFSLSIADAALARSLALLSLILSQPLHAGPEAAGMSP